jgi:hypothetical protein
MKKIIAVLIILGLSAASFSQQLDSAKIKTRDDLLLKSKHQKTTGFLMLGLGAAAAITGTLIFEQNFDIWEDGNDALAGTGVILATAGGLSMLGSIPFFIASSKNKGRAMGMSAGIKVDKIIPDGIYKTQTTYYPALSVKLSLK